MQYFFDLDGTLIDRERAMRGGLASLLDFAPKLRIYSEEQLTDLWQNAEDRHFPRFERDEISYLEQRRERLRDVFSEQCGNLSDAELDQLYASYVRGYDSSWELHQDVLPALARLGDQPMALITNGDGPHQRKKVERFGLDKYFERIFISSEVGAAKPDKRIFEKACSDMNVPLDQVSFIGDHFPNDVRGSALAGMHAIWINREGKPKPEDEVSFREIRTLDELP